MSPANHIPSPRPFGPAPSLGWGVVGIGSIAARFVGALRRHGNQRVVAVGSRSLQRADAFAQANGIEHGVGSVEELVNRPDVHVVYVATPHNTHREVAEAALSAGKHVLVEKPLAPSTEDATAITEMARAAGLLAMEAMWTRYQPQADVLRQLLDQNAIGEVNYVSADFGFIADYDPAHRLFAPELAGGALLDAGVYPVSFIVSVLGAPLDVQCAGTLAPTGVDDHATITLGYSDGFGIATTSLRSNLPVRATIAGTTGRIEIAPPYILPGTLTLSTRGNWRPDPEASRWTDTTLADPYDALHYEAQAAASYIGEGRSESPIHDHAETLAVIRVLEEARRRMTRA